MLFYYIFTECVIPDVLNYRTHVKSTKGRVLLYPEITPCYTITLTLPVKRALLSYDAVLIVTNHCHPDCVYV